MERAIGLPETHTSIRVVFDYATANLPARLLRRSGRRVAFQFDASVNDGQLDLPPELLVRFRSIEMSRLRNRLRSRATRADAGRPWCAAGDGAGRRIAVRHDRPLSERALPAPP